MEYLNEFHKKTTEDKIRAIAEMKKTPTNYEEEYARHRMMLKKDMEQERKEKEQKQLQRCNIYASKRMENLLDEPTRTYLWNLCKNGIALNYRDLKLKKKYYLAINNLYQFKKRMKNNNQDNEAAEKGAFIRALIKINNPQWTPEQIDEELKKRLEALQNPQNDGECEMCSG